MSCKLQLSKDVGEQQSPTELNVFPRFRAEYIKRQKLQVAAVVSHLCDQINTFFAQCLTDICLQLTTKRQPIKLCRKESRRRISDSAQQRVRFSNSQPSQRLAGSTAAPLMWRREWRWWSDCVLEANIFTASADSWTHTYTHTPHTTHMHECVQCEQKI